MQYLCMNQFIKIFYYIATLGTAMKLLQYWNHLHWIQVIYHDLNN